MKKRYIFLIIIALYFFIHKNVFYLTPLMSFALIIISTPIFMIMGLLYFLIKKFKSV